MIYFPWPGEFELWLRDNRAGSDQFGRREVWRFGQKQPGGAIIPPGLVHAYRNIGGVDGLSLNLPDDLYQGTGKQSPVYEIRHERDLGTPFQVPPV